MVLHGLYVALLGLPTLTALAVFVSLWLLLLAAAWLAPLPLDFKKQHGERVPSTVHALTVSLGSLLTWTLVEPDCASSYPDHPWLRLLLLCTAGFLMVDFSSMMVVDVWKRWRKVDLVVLFHHLLVLSCILISVTTHLGIWFQASLLINELPVVPLNSVQMLRFFQKQQAPVYYLMKVCTGVLWVVCRLVAIPWSLWRLRSRGYCAEDWGLTIASAATAAYVLLFLMNLLWFAKLAQGARRPADGDAADSRKEQLLGKPGKVAGQ